MPNKKKKRRAFDPNPELKDLPQGKELERMFARDALIQAKQQEIDELRRRIDDATARLLDQETEISEQRQKMAVLEEGSAMLRTDRDCLARTLEVVLTDKRLREYPNVKR